MRLLSNSLDKTAQLNEDIALREVAFMPGVERLTYDKRTGTGVLQRKYMAHQEGKKERMVEMKCQGVSTRNKVENKRTKCVCVCMCNL